MDIASPNTEELTTARWFVMRAYKSEKRAEEKLKGKDGLEFLETLSKQVQWSCDGRYSY